MLSLLFTAALATATPLSTRQDKQYPPHATSTAFTLIANITSATPNPVFNPPITNWVLTTQRVGAGQYVAILAPDPKTPSTILFVNGTAADIPAENTSVMSLPLDSTNGLIPMGMQFGTTTGRLATVGINFGNGYIGTGISGTINETVYGGSVELHQKHAKLFPPAGMQWGTFIVRKEEHPVYSSPEYPVFWARAGVAEVPAHCEEIVLLAQCAELPEGVKGEKELNIVRAEVACYGDVKTIDWSKWSGNRMHIGAGSSGMVYTISESRPDLDDRQGHADLTIKGILLLPPSSSQAIDPAKKMPQKQPKHPSYMPILPEPQREPQQQARP
ncbi:hypothetical protein B0T16DRAFT_383948 [Cercophora newfieldiana]|uniref:DUF7907 domain-containing protein n=1 Tax=Cercophora newfieldiana TaxID=92897 RepID=A0AA39YLY4_9PEZI|nr:hypothetical protein B0T16DRAFT_383948 [Cercophora newfieldiana]